MLRNSLCHVLCSIRSLVVGPAVALVGLALLTGCQVIVLPVPVAAPAPAEEMTVAQPAALAAVEPLAPLPPTQALAPVQLSIPALGLNLPVTPMGWEVVEVEGERTTQWILPADGVGWHVNSGGAGGAGRVILSGHQVVGTAPLAPLAQGEVEIGQEIWLTDSDGVVFVYEVVEVSDPIVQAGATAEEEAAAADYVAPTDQAVLTLITGWPDFTTTHRVFAVAELVGMRR
jgi:sortase (surface protein transpeptidase)